MKFGHLEICPTYINDKQLLNFVRRKRNTKDRLSPEKIKKLDDIGFLWRPGKEVRIKVKKKIGFSNWLNNYEQLLAFKEKYGHCRVSIKSKEHRFLGHWVYSQMNKNDWLMKFNELKQYAKKYGNCQVPYKSEEYPELSKWVRTQRWNTILSKEQYRLLEKIGFLELRDF
jgi:hypothetical protein